MEPTPVPRTPVSQRIGAAASAESKEDAADAADCLSKNNYYPAFKKFRAAMGIA